MRTRWRIFLLSAALAAVMFIIGTASAYAMFPDVPGNHVYRVAIEDLATRGIIGGYTNGDFGPEDELMRQQFAKMIVKTVELPVTGDEICPFADVDAQLGTDPLYPSKYVAVCAEAEITKGVDATHFAPYEEIARLQVITMVVRAAENLLPGALVDPPHSWTGQLSYGDPTHGANLKKAEYNGLLAGLQGLSSSWNGYADASRGECAQVLYNLFGKAVLTADTITNPWWADMSTDPLAWRYDSRVGQSTVELPEGTALVYRAIVRNRFGAAMVNTDVSAFHPKMITLHTPSAPTITATADSASPDSYVTDASGYLYWQNGGQGYWGSLKPGDLIGVSFWLDFDDDGEIDAGAEADSNVPGWGSPWAQWLIGN